MNRKKLILTVSTILMILTMIIIGPLDTFTHGFFYQETDYSQILKEDFLNNIPLDPEGFEMQFSPVKRHFAGFEIILANQPNGNTGTLILTILDKNNKVIDTMEADLDKVTELTWYAVHVNAKLKAGEVYTLKFSAIDCDTYPELQVVDPDYLTEENVSGDILLTYAYEASTFTLQTKILICLFLVAVWGVLCSMLLPEKYKKGAATASACLFFTTVLSWNYMYNSMDMQNIGFPSFQADSETLVTGMIYADRDGVAFLNKNEKGYGMGRYHDLKGRINSYSLTFLTNEKWINGYSKSEPAICVNYNLYSKDVAKPGNYIQFKNGDRLKITKTKKKDTELIIYLDSSQVLAEAKYGSLEDVRFYDQNQQPLAPSVITAYKSQYGLQGKVLKRFARVMPEEQAIPNLYLLCSIATAAVFVLITRMIALKYNYLLAGCFYVTFWLSPWIVNFARNLYWLEFTWFLPMAAGLFCAWKIHSRSCRIASYMITFFTIALKCLCGYEYISVIMMGLISFLLADFICALLKKDKNTSRLLFRTIFLIGIIALLGFMTAVCFHAALKGEGNILSGIKTIFVEDVLRRTTGGDINEFAALYWPSFNASVWEVYCKYFHFSTEVITGIPGNLFPLLCIIPLCILGYEYKKKRGSAKLLAMYVVFFLSSISWFCLAKSHSYVHTHINYVLWYFGFVQICFYIILRKLAQLFQNRSSNAEKETEN